MAKEKEMKAIDSTDLEEIKASLKSGMVVRIYQKIKETNAKGQEKERLQYYEGTIIARKHGNEAGATITVSKVSEGVTVEKIFPLNLPSIVKIEVKKQYKVSKSKLYFLLDGYKKKLKVVK
ncbi:MAG: 50S ribosomal protein L19 [Candidatus Falkowbacteria bacterium]